MSQPELPVDPPSEEHGRREELFDTLNAHLAATVSALDDLLPFCDYDQHSMVVRVAELLADLTGELE